MVDAVQFFRALADETRLRILNLLVRGELCVCEIAKILDMGQSKVSRHLAYLRNAGLVVDRREGLWMYYSLAHADGILRRRSVEWLAEAVNEIPSGNKDLETLEELRSRGELCVVCPPVGRDKAVRTATRPVS